MFIDNVKLGDIPDNHLRALFNYWQSKKDGRTLPARSDIRPEEIHRLLSHVVLIDVEPNPLRFKARLVGSDIVNVIGRDFTGMYFDSFPNIDKLLARLERLLDSRRPYLVRDHVQWPAKSFMEYQALALPLSENDRDINIIMYGMYYPSYDRAAARRTG